MVEFFDAPLNTKRRLIAALLYGLLFTPLFYLMFPVLFAIREPGAFLGLFFAVLLFLFQHPFLKKKEVKKPNLKQWAMLLSAIVVPLFIYMAMNSDPFFRYTNEHSAVWLVLALSCGFYIIARSSESISDYMRRSLYYSGIMLCLAPFYMFMMLHYVCAFFQRCL